MPASIPEMPFRATKDIRLAPKVLRQATDGSKYACDDSRISAPKSISGELGVRQLAAAFLPCHLHPLKG